MKLCALRLSLSAVVLAGSPLGLAQHIDLMNAPLPAAVANADGNAVVTAATETATPGARMRLLDWAGIGAGAVLRTLDYTTTEKGMEYPDRVHEAILPTALVKNKAAFASFEAGTVALNYGAYRLLVRHNLRSLALVSQYMYLSIMTGQVAKNYQVLGKARAH